MNMRILKKTPIGNASLITVACGILEKMRENSLSSLDDGPYAAYKPNGEIVGFIGFTIWDTGIASVTIGDINMTGEPRQCSYAINTVCGKNNDHYDHYFYDYPSGCTNPLDRFNQTDKEAIFDVMLSIYESI